MQEDAESAVDWAILGLLSTLTILVYLTLRLLTVYLGKEIIGASVFFFSAGLVGFVIGPSILAVLIYLTWIRPMYRQQKPSRTWQLALIMLGTAPYIVPGLVLIVARRKVNRITFQGGQNS